MYEREREDSRHIEDKEVFASSSQVAFLRSEACAQHMTGMRRVRTGGWQLVFASVSQIRPSHEILAILAKHSILPICPIWYTLSLPTLYIPTLPTYVEEYFQRENPSHNPWEWEIVIPTILYTIHRGFPQLLLLHFYILERLMTQTFTTQILSVKWGFGAAGKHWKKLSFGRCN